MQYNVAIIATNRYVEWTKFFYVKDLYLQYHVKKKLEAKIA
jgi:hypothetical protein